MDFPLLPAVLWPTVSSMVSTTPNTLQLSHPSSTFSSMLPLDSSVLPDTFKFTYRGLSNEVAPVPLLRRGITWYTDKNIKYRNPKIDNLTLAEVFQGTLGSIPLIKHRMSVSYLLTCSVIFYSPCLMCDHSTGTTQPPYWHKPVYELDLLEPTDNGFINDDLIIWMREAAFPNFKKLYGVLYRADKPFSEGLPEGQYTIDISYSILPPVLKDFKGMFVRL